MNMFTAFPVIISIAVTVKSYSIYNFIIKMIHYSVLLYPTKDIKITITQKLHEKFSLSYSMVLQVFIHLNFITKFLLLLFIHGL